MSGLEGQELVGLDPILCDCLPAWEIRLHLEQDEVQERQVQGLDTNSLLHSQPNDYTKQILSLNWSVTVAVWALSTEHSGGVQDNLNRDFSAPLDRVMEQHHTSGLLKMQMTRKHRNHGKERRSETIHKCDGTMIGPEFHVTKLLQQKWGSTWSWTNRESRRPLSAQMRSKNIATQWRSLHRDAKETQDLWDQCHKQTKKTTHNPGKCEANALWNQPCGGHCKWPQDERCWFTRKFMRNQRPEKDQKQRDIREWSQVNGNKLEDRQDYGKSEVKKGKGMARGKGKGNRPEQNEDGERHDERPRNLEEFGIKRQLVDRIVGKNDDQSFTFAIINEKLNPSYTHKHSSVMSIVQADGRPIVASGSVPSTCPPIFCMWSSDVGTWTKTDVAQRAWWTYATRWHEKKVALREKMWTSDLETPRWKLTSSDGCHEIDSPSEERSRIWSDDRLQAWRQRMIRPWRECNPEGHNHLGSHWGLEPRSRERCLRVRYCEQPEFTRTVREWSATADWTER